MDGWFVLACGVVGFGSYLFGYLHGRKQLRDAMRELTEGVKSGVKL